MQPAFGGLVSLWQSHFHTVLHRFFTFSVDAGCNPTDFLEDSGSADPRVPVLSDIPASLVSQHGISAGAASRSACQRFDGLLDDTGEKGNGFLDLGAIIRREGPLKENPLFIRKRPHPFRVV